MAIRNKSITNTKTGQSIKFIRTTRDTGGQMLEIESSFAPNSKEPPPHYHPHQVEDFTVLSGELTIRIEGELQVLKTGETIYISSNKVHSMWNNTDKPAIVKWEIRPALNTEYFLENVVGLANDGKTNNEGVPGLLQVALLSNRFSGVFRLAKPPYLLQRIIFAILTPLAYLLGYRPSYKKYID